jgi:hypothetical protein
VINKGLASLFTGEDPPQEQCRCGSGWCPAHGSDHYSAETELLEVERRQTSLLQMHGTCGGTRLPRKKKRPE